jgi:hypothetical protein
VTQPLDFNVDLIRPVAYRPPQFGPHFLQGYRFQTLNFMAGLALEVGMGRVMLAGQLKMTDPALQGQLPHHAPVGKVFQDAVYCNLIHSAANPNPL